MSEALPSQWRQSIVTWAASKPRIHEVYLFGSRAKESHVQESDIDLAIVLVGEDEGARLDFEIFEADNWKNEVADLLPIAVDLQFAEPLRDLVVWPAVEEHGVLLYTKSGYISLLA